MDSVKCRPGLALYLGKYFTTLDHGLAEEELINRIEALTTLAFRIENPETAIPGMTTWYR